MPGRSDFRQGDRVWVNYPHMDTARSAPEHLDVMYEQLLSEERKPEHFLMLASGKKRPMLIIKHDEDNQTYTAFKCTTKLPRERYWIQAADSFIEVSVEHKIHERLITAKGKLDRLDAITMQKVKLKREEYLGMRPPSEKEAPSF